MKKKQTRRLRKALVMLSSVVVLMAIGVTATLAYLTDSEAVTNTFTVGQVGITLDEAKTNEMGQPLKNGAVVDDVKEADRTDEINKGNAYKLIPGNTYTKDPTVHMDAKSEPAYVRMLVTVTQYDELKAALKTAGLEDLIVNEGSNEVVLLQEMVGGWDASKWVYESATLDGTSMVYEFRYDGTPDGDDEVPALFDTFTLPGEIKNKPDNITATTGYIEHLAEMSINVEAHAIQAAGFADADAAWDAFDEQMAGQANG